MLAYLTATLLLREFPSGLPAKNYSVIVVIRPQQKSKFLGKLSTPEIRPLNSSTQLITFYLDPALETAVVFDSVCNYLVADTLYQRCAAFIANSIFQL